GRPARSSADGDQRRGSWTSESFPDARHQTSTVRRISRRRCINSRRRGQLYAQRDGKITGPRESLPQQRSREYYSHHEKVTISDTSASGAVWAGFARRSPVQFNDVLISVHEFEHPMTSPSEEPAWKQRAVERSIKTAKLRAAQRVQRFLDAAQAIIIEKGSTDFTVQEVVDRSRQSLRSFYLQFDGKHELLLALF